MCTTALVWFIYLSVLVHHTRMLLGYSLCRNHSKGLVHKQSSQETYGSRWLLCSQEIMQQLITDKTLVTWFHSKCSLIEIWLENYCNPFKITGWTMLKYGTFLKLSFQSQFLKIISVINELLNNKRDKKVLIEIIRDLWGVKYKVCGEKNSGLKMTSN